jgi:GTP-binding protein HflX
MGKDKFYVTQSYKEKAVLVGVEFYKKPHLLSHNDSLKELYLLADTAGLVVVGQADQKLDKPNPATFIGSGKVEEIKVLVDELQADIVLFDEELSPRHLRELEDKFGSNVRILDRTALILDIFSLHARTAEGKLQVELAQYEYRLPRLTRAWTHLARQAGGGGGRTGTTGGVGLRGPGETQLEVDRRQIRNRIALLKKDLEKVRSHRFQYRSMRKKKHFPVVALVGYTNAGKSSLLNQLTRSNVYVADKLFATLDPITRRLELPGGDIILITDTVGFIQKLPTQLIASFRATLEEILEADLLLNVVDINHPAALIQYQSVQQTLSEIGAEKIPSITVLNKVDLLNNNSIELSPLPEFIDAIRVSALKGIGIDELMKRIRTELFDTYVAMTVRLPYREGQLISMFHQNGQVDKIEHGIGGVLLKGSVPGHLAKKFFPYLENKKR